MLDQKKWFRMTKTLHMFLTNIGNLGKKILQICVDSTIIFSIYLVIETSSKENVWIDDFESILMGGFLTTSLSIVIFNVIGIYRLVLRHLSSKTLLLIIFGSALSALVQQLFSTITGLGPVVLQAFFFFSSTASLIVTSRVIAQLLINKTSAHEPKNVVIYGDRYHCSQLEKLLDQSFNFVIKAFVFENGTFRGPNFNGIKVLELSNLKNKVVELNISIVFVASATKLINIAGFDRLKELEAVGVEIKQIPSLSSMIDTVALKSISTDLSIQNVIGRPAIPPIDKLLRRNISNQNVMITGAGGTIGSELSNIISKLNPKSIILLDSSEFALYSIAQKIRANLKERSKQIKVIEVLTSMSELHALTTTLRSLNVHTIYHAAAYKHVPLIEDNCIEGMRNNVFATDNLVQSAVSCGVGNFILISSDKAVRPSNLMGASKRIAELICQVKSRGDSKTRFSTVRFGNVFGSSGSVIQLFEHQLAKGLPLSVTDPRMERYFMSVSEAAELVIQAGAMAEGGEVFVLDMGEAINILRIAKKMILLSGKTPFIVGQEPEKKGGVGIEIIGCRAGEKLFEELFLDEDIKSTSHDKILRAKEKSISSFELKSLLIELRKSIKNNDVDQLKSTLNKKAIGYLVTRN
jgi:FlaA1/EpsC-like NDP-sugar epimerase